MVSGIGMKSLVFSLAGLASLGGVVAECEADAYDVIVVGKLEIPLGF